LDEQRRGMLSSREQPYGEVIAETFFIYSAKINLNRFQHFLPTFAIVLDVFLFV
jgi:hypothetical protein